MVRSPIPTGTINSTSTTKEEVKARGLYAMTWGTVITGLPFLSWVTATQLPASDSTEEYTLCPIGRSSPALYEPLSALIRLARPSRVKDLSVKLIVFPGVSKWRIIRLMKWVGPMQDVTLLQVQIAGTLTEGIDTSMVSVAAGERLYLSFTSSTPAPDATLASGSITVKTG